MATRTAANEHVSAQMKRMPTANSGPEVALRRVLHRDGFRYRLHRRDLPGRPDLAFGPSRVAVFVDGCYWHACPEHGTLPKNNREWWRQKFEATRQRDRRKDADLAALGWVSIHVWEHEHPVEAAARVAELVRSRRRASTKVSDGLPTIDPSPTSSASHG